MTPAQTKLETDGSRGARGEIWLPGDFRDGLVDEAMAALGRPRPTLDAEQLELERGQAAFATAMAARPVGP
jgi:hypothetical protein